MALLIPKLHVNIEETGGLGGGAPQRRRRRKLLGDCSKIPPLRFWKILSKGGVFRSEFL